MSRHLFENAVTVQDMVTLCRENLKREENTSSEDLLQEEVMCCESVVREGA
jgi:hypothetical protein